mmetsp:Transcript_32322/g.52074  ORF Transcript_32322/g.52074 Transcript_32322/m.52074 type:complete len:301 (+) Transcript_32322:2140-3042(+)
MHHESRFWCKTLASHLSRIYYQKFQSFYRSQPVDILLHSRMFSHTSSKLLIQYLGVVFLSLDLPDSHGWAFHGAHISTIHCEANRTQCRAADLCILDACLITIHLLHSIVIWHQIIISRVIIGMIRLVVVLVLLIIARNRQTHPGQGHVIVFTKVAILFFVFSNKVPCVFPFAVIRIMQMLFVLEKREVVLTIKIRKIYILRLVDRASELLTNTVEASEILRCTVIAKRRTNNVIKLINIFERNLAKSSWVQLFDISECSIKKVFILDCPVPILARDVSKVVHDHAHEEVEHDVICQHQH